MVNLYKHQADAMGKLESGSILRGGVGSGKSRTALAYYFRNEFPSTLYIITTARKRDTHDWEEELFIFNIKTDVVVDSWNNIKKYVDVKDAFFILDEQRLVGSGAWVKSFLKIAKHNRWILLSATPGDVWLDYAPVFVANGFYRSITDFKRQHVIYNRYVKYPKVEGYRGTGVLIKYRKKITVEMPFKRHTKMHYEDVFVPYDVTAFEALLNTRWNPHKNKPIKDATELFILMRRLVNEDPRRLYMTESIVKRKKKVIIFYNFNYELELLRTLKDTTGFSIAEWNGQKHEPIPTADEWIYLVQYTAGAEGWNCVETNTSIFYSLNYSYKIMRQSAGRTDRMNTKFKDLYTYRLISKSPIDLAIANSLKNKKNFHEKDFKVT